MMITAARRANDPTQSFMFFRLLGIALLVTDVISSAVNGKWAGTEFWLLVLIGEYASIIRTIPLQVSERGREDR